jgi:phosphatidylglycerol:prolipoprotein diacylglycerol transferase
MIKFPVSPIAFQIGPFELRWYGLFLALAVVWLIFWVWWQIRKGAKITTDTMLTLALVGVPSGIIFARLIHVVDNIVVAKTSTDPYVLSKVVDYTQNWASIIGGEGLSIWGAVLGAALGCWIYCKITKIKIGYVFDIVAPGIIMAQAIGRLGCLMNGCCYGIPTTLPIGMEYTNPLSLGYGAGFTYPTVPFEIIFNVFAFVLLFKLRGRVKPAGSLFLIYLSLYAVWRLGIDFIRDGNPFLFGLHQAQVISIIILLFAVPWLAMNARFGKPELEPIETELATVKEEPTGTA